MEVASLKQGDGYATEVVILKQGEGLCYRGSLFNGVRMVMLRRWPV